MDDAECSIVIDAGLQSTEHINKVVCLGAQESLRKYSVVPVVTRKAVMDDEICGYRVPSGTYIACCIQAIHQSWKCPDAWQPERFLPGEEYDNFPLDIKPYMVRPTITFAGS
jgi:cytochrome P450